MVFCVFPSSLDIIANRVEKFLQDNLKDDAVYVHHFTTSSVVSYTGKMVIHLHCDCCFKKDGSFDDKKLPN